MITCLFDTRFWLRHVSDEDMYNMKDSKDALNQPLNTLKDNKDLHDMMGLTIGVWWPDTLDKT